MNAERIDAIRERLTPREYGIAQLRLRCRLTMQEIADALGIEETAVQGHWAAIVRKERT